MEKIKKQAIKEVAKRTGLKVGAVQELLRNGWTYIEEINAVPRWEHPSGQLQVARPEQTNLATPAGHGPLITPVDFLDVRFVTEEAAAQAIAQMQLLINEFGTATVDDFMCSVGLTSSFRDSVYGWQNIAESRVEADGHGFYKVVMPTAVPLIA